MLIRVCRAHWKLWTAPVNVLIDFWFRPVLHEDLPSNSTTDGSSSLGTGKNSSESSEQWLLEPEQDEHPYFSIKM